MKKKNKTTVDNKYMKLIKTITIIVTYVFYSYLINYLFEFSKIAISKDVIGFISDLIFIMFLILAYRKELASAYKQMKKNLFSNCKKVLLYSILVVILMIVMNLIKQKLNIPIDINSKNLSQLPLWYFIFKALIFSTIAEPLVFIKSIEDIVDNKYLFCFLSCFFFAMMSIIGYSVLDVTTMFYFAFYFILNLYFVIIYLKTDNIVVTMQTKLLYNVLIFFLKMVIECL